MNKIFKSKDFYKDLLIKVLVMFGAGYIVLFGAETILPGVVADVFNLNFLFLIFFIALFFLLALPLEREVKIKFSNKISIRFFGCLVVYLVLILFFALYKVSIMESVWYMFLSFLALKGFYELI